MLVLPIKINVTYPPSANRLWRFFKNRPVKSSIYKYWLENMCEEINEQFKHPVITFPVHISLSVGLPDRRKRDLDNRIKPCLDLLEYAQVLENDNLVHSLNARWQPDLKDSVIIEIDNLT
tara:strand:+ start:2235 stop:2594 length:360 start_codon:yes stop_codon:yes gene_type:complete